MNKFVVISILLVIAVLLATDSSKSGLRKNKLHSLKSMNTRRLNKLENSTVSVKVSGTPRAGNVGPKMEKKDYLILPAEASNNAQQYVEGKYKNILKEWDGMIH
jgi:hypothetical protein